MTPSFSDRPVAEARILEQASSLFMQRGVKNVSMDELAQKMGISKKTIYQHFKNKAEIVFQISSAYCNTEEKEMVEVLKGAKNAIDELIKILVWVSEALRQMNPNLIYELQKYYPRSWEIHQNHMNCSVGAILEKNLHRGVEEGFFRAGIDVAVTARARLAQMDMTFNERFFPHKEFSAVYVNEQMLRLYIFGIVSEKGRKYLRKIKF